MTFNEYLFHKQFAPSTVRSYERTISVFFTWLNNTGREAQGCTYTDLLDFVKHCHERGANRPYTTQLLTVIRHYYHFLKYCGEVQNSPATGLFIRGRHSPIPHDLLTAEQLEEMYLQYEQKKQVSPSAGIVRHINKRNKVMLGMLIYQGLSTAELIRMETGHLQLNAAKITVPGTKRSNSRVLKMEAGQMLDMQEYVNKTRPLLLSLTEKQTEKLFVSAGASDKFYNSIDKLMRHLRRHYQYLLSVQQLRQSRIALWLKQYDIRQVQYMTGHKYVSSTERYESANLEDLQRELEKMHPLAGAG